MWPSPQLAAALPAGARLGRYECIRRIAVGGMAELYLGRVVGPRGFEKLVAIKRILPQRVEDVDFVKMFVHEARIAASLDHANVVKVIDFGEDGEHPYLVMEYLHGRDLSDLRRTVRGPLPLPVSLALAIAVARGLHYVHDHRGLGLVHRDISPSNVFVCFSGEVKVVDFGIAKATEATMGTRSGALKGKLAYMSPEQCTGGAVDRRSDVHALGNLLYGLTTGRRMYSAPNEFGLLNRVARGEFEPPRAVCPGYPEALEAIVLEAVALDPAARWPTAKAFGDALEAFAAAQGLRVGSSVVAELMTRTFGSVPYPSIDAPTFTDPPAVLDAAPASTGLSDARRSRVRGRIAVAGALGVGAVLGVWLGPGAAQPHAATEAAPSLDAASVEPPADRVEPPEAAPVPTSAPTPDALPPPRARVEAEHEPAATASPAKDRRSPRKAKRARSGRRSAKQPQQTRDRPAHSDIFLPPSQRD